MEPNQHERRQEEVITCPTKKVVNVRTRELVRTFIHPTEIINVNRTIIRNKHKYSVHEREVHEKVEEGTPGCDVKRERRPRPFWF
ncbi:CotD family spore coat protein [Oceanobacillus sp. AG]|uniref:CotD family spore coat protein n=1 Tax=Oceanobacillus sp. AG TaxID=2681969 RepID=UPI0012EC9F44|nr:CotD family spore coat protein [Oceanobacillus sp. AG]